MGFNYKGGVVAPLYTVHIIIYCLTLCRTYTISSYSEGYYSHLKSLQLLERVYVNTIYIKDICLNSILVYFNVGATSMQQRS